MVVQPLTGDRQSVLERVQEVSGDGDTSLIDAVDLGLIIGQSKASIYLELLPRLNCKPRGHRPTRGESALSALQEIV